MDNLCHEHREKEWREYVAEVIEEIQQDWTEEDFNSHRTVNNPAYVLQQFQTRNARRDFRNHS